MSPGIPDPRVYLRSPGIPGASRVAGTAQKLDLCSLRICRSCFVVWHLTCSRGLAVRTVTKRLPHGVLDSVLGALDLHAACRQRVLALRATRCRDLSFVSVCLSRVHPRSPGTPEVQGACPGSREQVSGEADDEPSADVCPSDPNREVPESSVSTASRIQGAVLVWP